MKDIVVGLLALGVGAIFCFRGYLALRVVIPIWGAFAGFFFGAGLIASIGGDGFLTGMLGWVVGFVFALVFAAFAYFFYEVSVLIAMSAIGFTQGTALMTALGIEWSWLVVLVGVVVGALLAFIAIVADLPMMILTILTASAGATTIVAGLMMLVGTIAVDDLDAVTTTERLDDAWWWYVIYGALVIAGIIAQVRDIERFRASLRETWSESGGKSLRAT